jgi:AcrR family transcriptional regulator
VSRPTIYRYFRDRDTLTAAMIELRSRALFKKASKFLKSAANKAGAWAAMCSCTARTPSATNSELVSSRNALTAPNVVCRVFAGLIEEARILPAIEHEARRKQRVKRDVPEDEDPDAGFTGDVVSTPPEVDGDVNARTLARPRHRARSEGTGIDDRDHWHCRRR